MIKSFIIYIQFFTRINIKMSVDISYLKKGVPYLTFFGFLYGFIHSFIYWTLQIVIPGHMAWVIVFLVDYLITGGFHLDALADTADGLFSSRSKDRMLEIMKDSRVGSNGAVALIFYYCFVILSYPFLNSSIEIVLAAIAMIGKSGLALQLFNMKYARVSGGAGQVFEGVKKVEILISQIITISILFILFSYRGLIGYLIVLMGAYGYRSFVYKKINGHTGDTIGAYVCLAQVLFLMVLTV